MEKNHNLTNFQTTKDGQIIFKGETLKHREGTSPFVPRTPFQKKNPNFPHDKHQNGTMETVDQHADSLYQRERKIA